MDSRVVVAAAGLTVVVGLAFVARTATSQSEWEGNTLVVDVTSHNAKVWFDHAANFYSAGVHIVERFTLVDRAFPLRRNTERGFRLLEEACHEGERNTDPLIKLGYKRYPGI